MNNRLFAILLSTSAGICIAGVILVAVMASDRAKRQADSQSVPISERASDALAEQLPIIFDVPEFSYIDQNGQRTTRQELRGHVWVANFIFTQCTSICPTMTAKMIVLQRQITDPNVRFVSFSVDPEHDTPEVLNGYAKQWNADEKRWHLLSTNAADLAETAKGMKVAVQKTNDPANPINHVNYFFLIDGEGRVRGIYNSGDRETMDRLAMFAAALAANNMSQRPNTQLLSASLDGKGLFAALGCGVCHGKAELGPPLEHLMGREIKLRDGMTVVADDAYLRESIVNPPAKIVAGYQATMPGYEGLINDEQVDKLVAYLRTLGPGAGVGSAMTQPAGGEVKLVVDPVCKMHITVNSQSLQYEHEGETYYFCAEVCKDKFIADPNAFLSQNAQ